MQAMACFQTSSSIWLNGIETGRKMWAQS